MFAEFIEWRAEHSSDDLMTELLAAESTNQTGRTGRCHAPRCCLTPR